VVRLLVLTVFLFVAVFPLILAILVILVVGLRVRAWRLRASYGGLTLGYNVVALGKGRAGGQKRRNNRREKR
jgi:hypothetical protein